jgi:hypothetical protein
VHTEERDGHARSGSLVDNPVAWIVLLAVYLALGVWLKSWVLNWIVGPLFPLVFLYLVPTALARRRSTAAR